MANIRVIVHGVLGKMGQEVLNAVTQAERMDVVGGADYYATGDSIDLPDNSGQIPLRQNIQDILDNADVVVDFTNAEGATSVIDATTRVGVNAVIGSTGLSQESIDNANKLSTTHGTGIIIAPNFAMGAVLMSYLVEKASRFFEYADLTEVHREGKIDAPSGTALAIAQAAVNGRQGSFTAPTPDKELVKGTRGGVHQGVVIHSGRMPGRVAHHEMVFGALGQTLTIRHDSINRESFMPGVLMAIKASTQQKGLVLGLDKIMGL